MSIKRVAVHICDGCGGNFMGGDVAASLSTIKLKGSPAMAGLSGEYHLCNGCMKPFAGMIGAGSHVAMGTAGIQTRKGGWSEEEVDFLIRNVPVMRVAEIAEQMGRTQGQIYGKIKVLVKQGLIDPPTRTPGGRMVYSKTIAATMQAPSAPELEVPEVEEAPAEAEAEDPALAEAEDPTGNKARAAAAVSEDGTVKHGAAAGLKAWTAEEIEYAASAVKLGNSHAEIGEQLGRSAKSVQSKLSKLEKQGKLDAPRQNEQLFEEASA